ncbi:MAG TPA: NAD(P)-dependent oxidoreductase, partial [Hymenobacter sp.]|nr:NAD(P)-dependent oxidoreductase [Hymenobacter sp.]
KVWNVNVDGTFNLLSAMNQSGVTSLVYASSIVAPRGHGWHRATPDELPYLPMDDEYPFWAGVEEAYTLSKQLNELTVRMFANRGLLHSATALRIAQVGNASEANGPGALHTENPSWTLVDVKDVAQAFRLAVEKQLPGHQAFFIGSRYRYRADGERQTPAETRAELAAAGLGNVPEKPGFLQEWQAIATSERAENMLGYNPHY